MVDSGKRQLNPSLRKVKLYTKLSMRVLISFVLLGFIGWNTVITQRGEAVWYTLLGNLTSYWLPSFEDKDEEEEEDKNKKDASN